VCSFQRRGVIDAVAGHGNRFAVSEELPGNAQLVFRCHPGVNGYLLHPVKQGVITHGFKVTAGQHPFLSGRDTQLPADSFGGNGMVTGDHHHPHTGPFTAGNGFDDLRPGRVDHTLQTGK